jgi:hypothetical protein
VADDPGPPVTLDPEPLQRFVDELLAAGFQPADTDGRAYLGPIPASLAEFTDATQMTIVIVHPWPYRQPAVVVPGIEWWHAAHDMPCLWQPADNTKRWITLQGILDRIDEWAEQANAGFTTIDGAALDPQLYFERHSPEPAALDIDELIGGLKQDGQHGLLHLDVISDGLHIIKPGKGPGQVSGRWFYRTTITAPPRDLESFQASLTDNQRTRMNRILATHNKGLFALAWPTIHGTACLVLVIDQTTGDRRATSVTPTPISRADRLRRAGPDAAALGPKKVVLFGAGAIGSHVGSLLSRSGVGTLVVVDGDVKVPVGIVRHASSTVGVGKATDMSRLLAPFDWTTVEEVPRSTWELDRLGELITDADLCIDATGLTPFAELLSRVAAQHEVPMLSVALYRGGRIIRVRRQGPHDHPIVHRTGHWRYPSIPTGADRTADYLGAETGCAAPIHNAPPAAVTLAASLAVIVAIDFLTGRMTHPDEVIDTLEPIDAPFDKIGRHTPKPPTIMITEAARRTMIAAAHELHPDETGGVLIGLLDDTGAPCITHAVEFRPEQPSPKQYLVLEGSTTDAVDAARVTDPRVGYLGEWHSHPTDQPASPMDRITMTSLAAHPDTGDPVLLVVRPTGGDNFAVDAHIFLDANLMPAPLVEIGPIAAEETS